MARNYNKMTLAELQAEHDKRQKEIAEIDLSLSVKKAEYETRKQKLVGKCVLAKLKEHTDSGSGNSINISEEILLKWLDTFLTKNSDRVLFDLPKLAKKAEQ